jgi:putative oxidoreductase
METTVRRTAFDMAAWSPHVLGALRIVTAFLFMSHGMAKILHVPFLPQYANLSLLSLVGAAGLLELVGGAFLLVGLFTRPVAFILSGEMAFAYFLGHMFKNPAEPAFLPLNNGGTAAILFCFACLYLATAGGGPYSVDEVRKK